jgi:adenosylcobinamide-phosphate synthase
VNAGPAIAAGYAADLAFGDPRRGHPVAGFGALAAAAERRWYEPSRARGALVTGMLVAGAAAVGRLAGRLGFVATAAVAWAALGGRSLRREADHVGRLVADGELDEARFALRSLCGRDAAGLDGDGLSAAVVESLAENSSDAVVGALWWGLIAGPAGIAGYRAANTLDAMFGHRDDRYREFGWAAAKLDDALNWLPARLAALLTCALAPLVGGSATDAWRALRDDAPRHPSPNAGQVEAAFAGALGVTLGGPLSYGGQSQRRPNLGSGPRPAAGDIRRAARLSRLVCGTAAAVCATAGAVRGR